MKVVRGKLPTPYQILVYGPEGCGKTTFASTVEDPIFLCAEEGTDELDVARARRDDGEPLRDYEDACGVIEWLTNNKHEFKTLVIDTVDWLHLWLEEFVCRENSWDHVMSPGYGNGPAAVVVEWRWFLKKLETLSRTKKMHILLLGHSSVKKYDPPDGAAYDRYTLKMPEGAGCLIKEWCKAVLFARPNISVVKDGNSSKGKAYGNGDRVLFTEATPAAHAKNRFGLPPVIELNENTFSLIEQHRTVRVQRDFDAEFLELMKGHPEEASARDWFDKQSNKSAALEKLRERLAQEEKKAS